MIHNDAPKGVELLALPRPKGDVAGGGLDWTDEEMIAYARANVEASVAGYIAQHHRDSATLREACAERDWQKARAERLSEALRIERNRWMGRKADAIAEQSGGLTRGDPEAIARCDAAIQRIDAALATNAAQPGETE